MSHWLTKLAGHTIDKVHYPSIYFLFQCTLTQGIYCLNIYLTNQPHCLIRIEKEAKRCRS